MIEEPRLKSLSFRVLGTPASKGSNRAFIGKSGRAHVVPGGSKVGAEKLGTWDANVRAAALEAAPAPWIARPLSVEIHFYLRRPAGHFAQRTGQLRSRAPSWPATKPDVDKLARSTLDSLTAIVFDDDSRVVMLRVTKHYARSDQPEGALISVDECET